MCIVKTFEYRQHTASVGLTHARINISTGLSDANATLSLLAQLFPCCVSRKRNISSRSCHCTVYTVGNTTIAKQAAVHDARWRKNLEKNSKGDVKNIFWQMKIRPLILNKSGRKRARPICREIQEKPGNSASWQVLGKRIRVRDPRMHVSSNACVLILIWKPNMHACLTG